MSSGLGWTTGKVVFLYVSGILLGANLLLLLQALEQGRPLPVLGVAVVLMMPVLPIAAAYRDRRRADIEAAVS